MLTALFIFLGVMSYGFIGNTTGLTVHRRLTNDNGRHRESTGIKPYLAGVFWPLVIPSTFVFKSSEYVLDKLEAKKKQKLLPKATAKENK